MSRRHTAGAGRASVRPRRTARCSAGVLGMLGSVACAASMILAAAGVGGAAAAASMAAMTGTGPGTPGGALGALVRAGPWLMPAAVALVTAAFALTRRPVTAVPALLAGAVLDAGMYAQHSLPVMYASIVVGYLAWAAWHCGRSAGAGAPAYGTGRRSPRWRPGEPPTTSRPRGDPHGQRPRRRRPIR